VIAGRYVEEAPPAAVKVADTLQGEVVPGVPLSEDIEVS